MGQHGQYRALVTAAALGALVAGPAAAGCRLALILALDISASVDEREDGLQRQGLARALVAPEVAEAFLADPRAPVSLAVYEWSGEATTADLLDWFEIGSAEDLRLAAGAIAASTRSRADRATALGHALGHAARMFAKGPDCDARTLDVSGDGRSNEGVPPGRAYRLYDFAGVTVNGLAIGGGEAGVADYYRRELIRGPGAFVIEASGFRDYERAMRAKLLRELAPPVIGWQPADRRPG